MAVTGSVRPTDSQLVAASRFDGVHFVTVFDRHGAGVGRYLSHRLGPAAPEQLGETFVAAYGQRRRFRPWDGSAAPWLLGVASGVVRTHWRAEQANLRALAAEASGPFVAEVAEQLQHLDARDRDVLLLAAWEGLASAEVAGALDLPDATVAARLDGVARRVRDRVGATVVRAAGPLPAALDLVRSLRPSVEPLGQERLAAVRAELLAMAGHPTGPGRPRSTRSVAAEHEQLRRWRSGPGNALAALRHRGGPRR